MSEMLAIMGATGLKAMGVMMTVPTINYIANKANTSNKWVRRLIIGIGLIGIGLLASVSIDAIMWIKSLGVM